MSSLSELRLLELTVFGYIRKIEKLSSNQKFIPTVIKELIIAYARNCFSWYTKIYGKGYRFYEDNALQAEKTEDYYSFLTSANVLSLEVCHKFEWEITIIESNVANYVDLALMIGFIAYPLQSSISLWDTYFNTEKHFGMQACSTNIFLGKYGRDGYSRFAEQNERYKIKNGDRFCIRFDFEKSKCSFGYNDQFTEDVYTDIPSKIIPTICIFDPMIFACTKWNEIFEESSNKQ